MYKIQVLTTQIFAENIYFLIDPISNKTILVDPGEISLEKLDQFMKELNILPVAILNTHAHPDHISKVKNLQDYFQIPFFLHIQEKEYLEEFTQLGLMIGFENFQMPQDIQFIIHGKFEFEGFKFDILHTPGHTKGSICILFDNQMISGDTLFQESIGRVDLPGGSMVEMKDSIKLLKNLDENIIVYPGHGDKTTIKNEIENNPYF